ncbi:OPSP protein, partial [Catharus fuscescens]|nr:OPSP protein [Catharus fuscescens]
SCPSPMEPPNSSTPGPFDGPQWPHQAPRALYVAVAVLMALLVASASLLNGLVIVVSARHRRLRSPLNHILVNLAVANLLVTLSGSSVSLATNARGFFAFGERLCQLEGFMVSLTGIVGLWSLAILALERYLVVCRPLGDFRFRHRHAAGGCAFTWGWALLWTTPPLLGWSSYVPEGLRTSCGPNWYTGGSNNSSYILTLFVTCFVMPLSLILFSYTNLVLTLRAVSQGAPSSSSPKAVKKEIHFPGKLKKGSLTGPKNPGGATIFVPMWKSDHRLNPGAAVQEIFPKIKPGDAGFVLPQITCPFLPAQFQSCLLGMLCCGYHPRGMGKTSPAAPSPQGAAEGLRNKVTPSHPV